MFRLASDLGLPVVATNDAHFLSADDHDAHDILLCIGLGVVIVRRQEVRVIRRDDRKAQVRSEAEHLRVEPALALGIVRLNLEVVPVLEDVSVPAWRRPSPRRNDPP